MGNQSHQSLSESWDRDVLGQLPNAQPLFPLRPNKREGITK